MDGKRSRVQLYSSSVALKFFHMLYGILLFAVFSAEGFRIAKLRVVQVHEENKFEAFPKTSDVTTVSYVIALECGADPAAPIPFFVKTREKGQELETFKFNRHGSKMRSVLPTTP